MRNTAIIDYSTNNSFQWTDSDYDDITLVISCRSQKSPSTRAESGLTK